MLLRSSSKALKDIRIRFGKTTTMERAEQIAKTPPISKTSKKQVRNRVFTVLLRLPTTQPNINLLGDVYENAGWTSVLFACNFDLLHIPNNMI